MLGERPWAVQPWMTKLLSVNSANKARNNLRKDRVMFEWSPIPKIPTGEDWKGRCVGTRNYEFCFKVSYPGGRSSPRVVFPDKWFMSSCLTFNLYSFIRLIKKYLVSLRWTTGTTYFLFGFCLWCSCLGWNKQLNCWEFNWIKNEIQSKSLSSSCLSERFRADSPKSWLY